MGGGLNGNKYRLLVTNTTSDLNIPEAERVCPITTNAATLTVNPTTGATSFSAGATTLCQDAPNETYTASAANATSITYSVSPAGAGSINSSTGAMNWDAGFSGTATITATAAGLCGTTSATRNVTVNPTTGATSFSAGATTLCQDAPNETYTASAANATSITYSVSPAGAGSINSSTGAMNWDAGFSGTATITATAAGLCGTTSATRNVTVNPFKPASVNISANTSGPICAGTSVTFTATPTNGGTTPSYQWKVNGNNVGTSSYQFSSSTLANGDKVTVVMTSNASPCLTSSPATSNEITMTVNNVIDKPALSILISPDCGVVAKVVNSETGEPFGEGFQFSYDRGGSWTDNAILNYTPGDDLNIWVRRNNDNTCISSTTCQSSGAKLTSQTSSSIQSTEQLKADDQLTAYPIPFAERTTLEFKAERSGKYEINLYDMKGTLIRQLKSGTAKEGEVTQIEVDGRSMADGMYLARMVSGSGAKTVKLLKKNN
ncbi:T9SS type A sorting domain-containing protein [Pontibacter aydingkolensis]|uniref:T9SS type A sorting domain-containing protein n=2 Tax=Pontibacter aydingkolensis TaxID=1911536 RepID=A0ABS7CP83_9BACT|nr:T9SS type A sorting domain-containing protein [Pontibacter aydingkolensis]MBW7465651.1 T9SS type A sorting domain-containing protein [Pontibacter aydingkolensis]